MSSELSKDEAAIYDRQIRLWGLDAQQRISRAKILIAGLRGLSDEVCKNIALAGVANITLLDHEKVTELDLGAQFFLNDSSVGKNRAEAAAPAIKNLNPRVDVVVDQDNIKEKPDEYFETFDIVCLIHVDYATMCRVDEIRRKVKKPFYTADAFGWFGYIFCDLTEHAYVLETPAAAKPKSKEAPATEKIKHVEKYSSLLESLNKNWSDMRLKKLKKITPMTFLITILLKFEKEQGRPPTQQDIAVLLENKSRYLSEMGVEDATVLDDSLLKDLATLYDTETSAVTAIVGGILAQDILRTLSANALPIKNWFYFNGLDGSGVVLDN